MTFLHLRYYKTYPESISLSVLKAAMQWIGQKVRQSSFNASLTIDLCCFFAI